MIAVVVGNCVIRQKKNKKKKKIHETYPRLIFLRFSFFYFSPSFFHLMDGFDKFVKQFNLVRRVNIHRYYVLPNDS